MGRYIYKCKLTFENINELSDKEREKLANDLKKHLGFNRFFFEETIEEIIVFDKLKEISFSGDWDDYEKGLDLLTRLYPNLKISLELKGEDWDDYSIYDAYKGEVHRRNGVVSIEVFYEDRQLW